MPPPVPPPPVPPLPGGSDDRQWIVGLHLSALLFFVFPFVGNILAPLIIWNIKKDQMPSVDLAGRAVLNFQISWGIYMVLAGFSIYFCVGAILLPVVFVAWLVILIIGAVKASNGEAYTFPLTIKML